MSYGAIVARIMLMNESVWERHANPWSCWTRLAIAPLLALSIWSRSWIGWWCLLPLVILIIWIWVNPRIFAKPVSTDNWASKAVFGERVWLNRHIVPLPARHVRMAHMLNFLAALGMIPLIWGLVSLDFWMLIAGLGFTMGAKMWFLDRMVWLYDEVRVKHAEYQRWLRP